MIKIAGWKQTPLIVELFNAFVLEENRNVFLSAGVGEHQNSVRADWNNIQENIYI